jgi:hypothetical protein
MQNLRDKLLKAGLVSEDQVKKNESDSAHKKDRPNPPPSAKDGAFRADARPQGERPAGDRPRGDRPHGDRPRGDRPQGDRPRGDRPPGNRPHGDRPQGTRPRGDRPAHAPRQGGTFQAPRTEDVRIPKLPPLPGSKAAQRMESRKQLELDKKLRELVLGHQIPLEPGGRTFYFVTRKNRLRRLEVSEAQAALLEAGQLAVVERPEPAMIEHSLVPPDIAEQMLALSQKSVRFFNKGGAPVGFISDEELKERQEAEKHAGPEDHSREDESAEASAPEGEPSAETASAEAPQGQPAAAEATPEGGSETPSGT